MNDAIPNIIALYLFLAFVIFIGPALDGGKAENGQKKVIEGFTDAVVQSVFWPLLTVWLLFIVIGTIWHQHIKPPFVAWLVK